jgi:hypothetical protein
VNVLAIPGMVYARVYCGVWIVDCHVCRSALAVPVGTTAAECWDCGELLTPIAWPPDPGGIELLLSHRRVRHTRNWLPGETLEDLLAENAEHGIFPPQLDLDGPSACLMQTVNGVITGGLLHNALTAARPRLEIGA